MFYKEFGVCLSEPALRTALVAINDLRSNYMRGKIDSKYVEILTRSTFLMCFHCKSKLENNTQSVFKF